MPSNFRFLFSSLSRFVFQSTEFLPTVHFYENDKRSKIDVVVVIILLFECLRNAKEKKNRNRLIHTIKVGSSMMPMSHCFLASIGAKSKPFLIRISLWSSSICFHRKWTFNPWRRMRRSDFLHSKSVTTKGNRRLDASLVKRTQRNESRKAKKERDLHSVNEKS